MKSILCACLVLLATPCFAQQSVPRDRLRFGPGFSEAAGRDEFRRGAGRGRELQGPRLRLHALEQRQRSGLCAGRRAASRIRPPMANSSAKSARASTPGPLAHSVRIDKDDNIWAIDKGSDMVIKFNPAGRVRVGVRPPQGIRRRRRQALGTRQSAAAAGRRPVPPAHRRRLGLQGQHLHQRRLHQFARRQIRQERRLGEVMGRAGHRPGPVPPAARHRDRPQRQRLCRRPHATGASRCSIPTASSCACSRSTCRRIPAPAPSTATRRPATASPR